jgi:hypothetical protein
MLTEGPRRSQKDPDAQKGPTAVGPFTQSALLNVGVTR